MEHRSLGRTGVKVSPLCLGCMNFGGKTDEADAVRIIARAIDEGINFIDTANVYHRGASERIVGKALQESGKRESVVLATKVHGRMGAGRRRAAQRERATRWRALPETPAPPIMLAARTMRT